jgi:hypothetical protein
MSEEKKSEVVQVPDAQPVNAVADWTPFGVSDSYWCSLVPQTDEQRDLVFLMREGDTERLKENTGVVIELVHVLAHPVSLAKPDGEIIEAVRCVLLDVSGKAYQCVSEGVRRTLATLFRTYGTPDTWKKPKRLKVRLLSVGNGRSMLKLEPAANVLDAKKK